MYSLKILIFKILLFFTSIMILFESKSLKGLKDSRFVIQRDAQGDAKRDAQRDARRDTQFFGELIKE